MYKSGCQRSAPGCLVRTEPAEKQTELATFEFPPNYRKFGGISQVFEQTEMSVSQNNI